MTTATPHTVVVAPAAPETERAPGGATPPAVQRTRRSWREILRSWRSEAGAATAEYAIALLAAVGFAGVLVVILRGDEVREILTNLVRNALNAAP